MDNFFLVSIFGLLIIAAYVSAQNTTCSGENEEYTECGSCCPLYCTENGYYGCIASCKDGRQCKVGCQCKDGYFRKAVESGKCISKAECDKIPKCGPNKEFRPCGSCPKYCGRPTDIVCLAVCVRGCQCKTGYVKKSENSEECIPENQCPK